jgi:hypothetical protein
VETEELITNYDRPENLKSQSVTSSLSWGGRRKLPYAFTEQGVAMLSAVLKSEVAINASIRIMNAFVEMRKVISQNAGLFQRMEKVERKQVEADEKIDRIFNALEAGEKSKQGIFYEGQIFDAYTFVSDLIRTAKLSIVLVDNYVDDSVLTMLTKRKDGVSATIYTKRISPQLKLDLQKHNTQYAKVEVKDYATAHDRFLIIDGKEIYHIGASLKDLGKKLFAFSRFDLEAVELLQELEEEE